MKGLIDILDHNISVGITHISKTFWWISCRKTSWQVWNSTLCSRSLQWSWWNLHDFPQDSVNKIRTRQHSKALRHEWKALRIFGIPIPTVKTKTWNKENNWCFQVYGLIWDHFWDHYLTFQIILNCNSIMWCQKTDVRPGPRGDLAFRNPSKIKFIQPAHLDIFLLQASSSHIRYTVRCSGSILLDNSNSVKQYATTTVVVDVQCPQCTYSAWLADHDFLPSQLGAPIAQQRRIW